MVKMVGESVHHHIQEREINHSLNAKQIKSKLKISHREDTIQVNLDESDLLKQLNEKEENDIKPIIDARQKHANRQYRTLKTIKKQQQYNTRKKKNPLDKYIYVNMNIKQ